jgi:ParB family chromosome partitioning protein
VTTAGRRPSGLGRGLASLIPQRPGGQSAVEIPLEQIEANPAQPRAHAEEDALQALARSIQEHGILQPIVVQETVDGYRLIAGERRVRAARMAGLTRIPAVVRGPTSDRQQLELALVENIQRADLNPLEEATAFRRLMTEFELTQEQVAQQVGRARSSVANTMRLLDTSAAIRDAVAQGLISEGHARALGGADETLQDDLLGAVLERDLSVRATEELVRRARPAPVEAASPTVEVDPDLERVETHLRTVLGTKVTLTSGSKGGRIIIEYYGPDDLGRLVERLGGVPA